MTPVRRTWVLLKMPLSMSRTRLVPWECPTPASSFQTGPSCRQVREGIQVRFRRSRPPWFSSRSPAATAPRVNAGPKAPGSTRFTLKVSCRVVVSALKEKNWKENARRSRAERRASIVTENERRIVSLGASRTA